MYAVDMAAYLTGHCARRIADIANERILASDHLPWLNTINLLVVFLNHLFPYIINKLKLI